MEKKLFHDEIEKIEVPKEDVLQAIKTGVRRANSSEKQRKNKVLLFSTAAAAVIMISSSFMFPSISKVMADMPLVGLLYKDLVGEDLASQKLITQVNETASSKGINVAITSAYYDGAVIGVTFDVKGNVKTDEDGRARGFYEIFNGDESLGETKEVIYMDPSGKGFSGHIQLSYPKSELPADTTFPLEFKSIGDKEGSWRFNVPIKQLSYETKVVDQESTWNHYKIHVDSIITGQASTAINYTATIPSQGKHDDIRMELYDDKGNPIHLITDMTLEKNKVGDQIIIKGRTNILQPLKGKSSYLEIRPQVAISEPNQFVSLNEQTPAQIKSDRQNLSVTVENIKLKDKTFTVDFQVNKGEKGNNGFMFFHDFARNDVTLVKESRKEIYEKPINHSVKTIDKDKLRFSSTFDLSELDNFNANDFVVRVALNSLAMNMPFELEPVKIDLK
ncbi:DUF4179 domain-containing protein [Neobacillus soli]|uniref:DUF4179 domain-containing protein n=1 Tax=Neobacillus soli TaxID=220688 RepID=UPI0008261BCB|nr:DUF4179 domain-containing protein [Neobacillus soli]